MFDIGGPELLLILILGLLIFGPRRLPQIGKQLGGFVAQMRQAMRDFQGTLEREVALEDIKDAARQVREIKDQANGAVRSLLDAPAAPAPSPPPVPAATVESSPAAAPAEAGGGTPRPQSGAPPKYDEPAG